ncbi:MAG: YlaN family protein, partial [Streptococcaceae bacterium]|nr:YlaN family protein [Streptococcaceae bacterium]
MNKTTNNTAFELLKEDADKIKNLINKQSHTMCISQCKAFEEVIDTQMYGLS